MARCNNETKQFDPDVKLHFKDFKILRKKLTAALMMDDSSYSSDDNSLTNAANDFIEVKTKIITKNKDHSIMLLYTSKDSNLTTDVSKNNGHSESYETSYLREIDRWIET